MIKNAKFMHCNLMEQTLTFHQKKKLLRRSLLTRDTRELILLVD